MGRLGSSSACLFGLSLLSCGTAESTSAATSGGGSGGSSSTQSATTQQATSVVAVGSGGSGGGAVVATCDPPPAPGTLWERNAETMAFEPVSMCQYTGDVLLIVNVAAL